MSDTASWFARHLGIAQPPQQQPQAYVQQPPQQYAPQQPQQYAQPQQQPVQQIPMEVDANGNPVIHVMDAAAAWKGTRKAREDTGICPECGSARFFLMQSVKMKRTPNGAHPSARCADCGYNDIFEQQYGSATPVDSQAPVVGTSPMIDTWNSR
jgi:hypothetical protein